MVLTGEAMRQTMFTLSHLNQRILGVLWLIGLNLAVVGPVRASDHGDTPLLIAAQRHDARLADLFAFTRGDNLVLIATLDPTIPSDATEYVFAPDLEVRILIDNDSEVTFDVPDDLAIFGGTVVEPQKIKKDIAFRIRFDEEGAPELNTNGLSGAAQQHITFFAGLRDDPFIRGPRIGRNIAAIVLELPLQDVLDDLDTLLIWATSKVEDINGPFQELAGRALRSQFLENDLMNTRRPRKHKKELGVTPDVVIFDISCPTAFPNGRELTDDVVDLVGDPRVLANDDPFPNENDLTFLNEFPYLAPPHPPGP